MFHDILHQPLEIPSQIKISGDLRDFLNKMLIKDPELRLGAKNGMLDVLNHPWCKKIKLIDVMNKKVKPFVQPDPYKLYFETFDTNQ